MKKSIIKSICYIFTILLANFANADVSQTEFQSTANLNSVCTISATPLVFGTVPLTSSVGTSLGATSSISSMCNNGVMYSIVTNFGVNPIGRWTYLKGNKPANLDKLAYYIYTDPSYTNRLGSDSINYNGETVGKVITATGNSSQQIVNLYGQLTLSTSTQYATPDDYSDLITLTLIY